jgi:hypothetical protein
MYNTPVAVCMQRNFCCNGEGGGMGACKGGVVGKVGESPSSGSTIGVCLPLVLKVGVARCCCGNGARGPVADAHAIGHRGCCEWGQRFKYNIVEHSGVGRGFGGIILAANSQDNERREHRLELRLRWLRGGFARSSSPLVLEESNLVRSISGRVWKQYI